MSLKTELQARVLDDENIELKTSQFSEREAFWLGKREFAYFFNDKQIHVRITRQQIRKLGFHKDSDPRVQVRAPSSDWIHVQFKTAKDVEFVITMLNLAIEHNQV
jgi:hypothetical protein